MPKIEDIPPRHPYMPEEEQPGYCRCGEPEGHPMHYTEAECALELLHRGFKIVNKKGQPATVAQLEAAAKRELAKAHREYPNAK